MVKQIAVKRTSKNVTLEQVLKPKVVKETPYYNQVEEVERRHRYKTSKVLRQQIDINLTSKINSIKIEEKHDTDGSYFNDIIQLKRSTYGSVHEKTYLYETFSLSHSLPMILFNLQKIVSVSVQYLKIGDKEFKACKQIILETLPYLIKDTREEFFDYFIGDIMNVLGETMNIEEVELYEKLFLLIAYGIKYLEKVIVTKYNDFFQSIWKHLFFAKHKITRQLAGEALSYLIRKFYKKEIIEQTFEYCQKNIEFLNEYEKNKAVESLSISVYQSVLGMQNYLIYNSTQILQKVCDQKNNFVYFSEFFNSLTTLIVEGVSEKKYSSQVSQKKNDLLLSLGDFYEFLTKQSELKDEILISSCICVIDYHQSKKLNLDILRNLLQIVSSVEQKEQILSDFFGKLLNSSLKKTFFQESILKNEYFIEFFLKTVNKQQLSKILQIVNETQNDEYNVSKELYQLILAASVRLLQNHESLTYWLELNQFNKNNYRFQVKDSESLLKQSDFYKIINFDEKDVYSYISACTIVESLQFVSYMEDQIKEILIENLKKINLVILEEWNKIKEKVNQQISNQIMHFNEFMNGFYNYTPTQIQEVLFVLSENLNTEFSAENILHLISQKIYTIKALNSLLSEKTQILILEIAFINKIISNEWIYFLHSNKFSLSYIYNELLSGIIASSSIQDLSIFESYIDYQKICLMSRSRQVRLVAGQTLKSLGVDSHLLDQFINIDSSDVTLENERHIKVLLLNLKNSVSQNIQLSYRFISGFSFCRFQLIRVGVVEILTQVFRQTSQEPVALQHFLTHLYLLQNQEEYLNQGDSKLFCAKFDFNSIDIDTMFEEVVIPSLTSSAKNLNEKTAEIITEAIIKLLDQKVEEFQSHDDIFQQIQSLYNKISKPSYTKKILNNKLINLIFKTIGEIIQKVIKKENIRKKIKQTCIELLIKDHEGIQQQCTQYLKSIELSQSGSETKYFIEQFFTNLNSVIDGKVFRQGLLQIDLNIPPTLKENFIQYLTRTLYPKLFSSQKISKKKLKGRYHSIEIRRNAVFDLLACLPEQYDLCVLFELIKDQHSIPKVETKLNPQEIIQSYEKFLRCSPLQLQMKFLNTALGLIDRLGYRILPQFLEQFVFLVLSLSEGAYKIKLNGGELIQKAKEVQKLCFKFLNKCLQKFSKEEQWPLNKFLECSIQLPGIQSAFSNIVSDSKTQPSSALKLLLTITSIPELNQSLMNFKNDFLSQFFLLYQQKAIQVPIDQIDEEPKINDEEPKINDEEPNDEEQQNIEILKKKKSKITQRSVIKMINQIFENIFNIIPLQEVKIGEKDQIMNEEKNNLSILFLKNYGEQTISCMLSYLQRTSNFQSIEYIIDNNLYSNVKDVETLYIFYSLFMEEDFNQCDFQLLEKCLQFFMSCIRSKNFYQIILETEQIPLHILRKKQISEIITFLIKAILSQMNKQQGFKTTSEKQIQWIFSTYSMLLTQTSIPLSIRAAIVDIIYLLNEIYPQYGLHYPYVEQLKLMNSKNNSVINDELDYDQCLVGCKQFSISLNDDLDESRINSMHIVMQNLFFLLNTPELSLRIQVLEIFTKYFKILQDKQHQEMINYVKKYLIPQLIQHFRESQQDEQLLRTSARVFELYLQTVAKNNSFMPFSDLYPLLCNKHGDEEQDVLSNLFAMQLNKRLRAVQILQKQLFMEVSSESIGEVLMPLLEYLILVKCCATFKVSDQNRNLLYQIQKTAIDCYSLIVRFLNWEDQVQLMQNYAKQLVGSLGFLENQDQNEQKTQALVKLLGQVVQNGKSEFNVIELIQKHKGPQAEENKIKLVQSLKKQFPFYFIFLKSQKQIEEEDADEQVKRVRQDAIDLEDIAEYKQISFKNLIREHKTAQKIVEEQRGSGIQRKDNQLWDEICKMEKYSSKEWADKTSTLLERVYLPIKNTFVLTTNQVKEKNQSEDKLRLQLSSILVELVIQFPPDTLMTELNRLVSRVCRSLKSRDQEIRDQGRQQLLIIQEKVGPIFFQFILNCLKNALNQGFENHVLNYTLHQMIQRNSSQGGIDYCLSDILQILMDEIYGQLRQEKEQEHMPKKSREVKSHTSFESIQLISQQMNVLNTLPKFIAVVDNYISTQSHTHQTENRLSDIFQRVLNGLLKNTTTPLNNPTEMIEFIYVLLAEVSQPVAEQLNKDHGTDFTLNQQSERGARFNREKIMMVQLPSYGQNSIMHFMFNSKLKTNSSIVFKETTLLAMKLFQKAIDYNPKTLIEALQNNISLEKLFVGITKIVVDCLATNEQSLITSSMNLMSVLVSQPISWIKQHKKNLVNNLLGHVAKLASSDTEMIKATVNLLKCTLDSPTQELAEFTPNQQKSLLEFLEVFIESDKENPIAEIFECLRTIIHKEWPQPKIYDLVDKCKETMIQSNNKRIQQLCKGVFVQFLVKYPLSSNLLQENIDYLLANVNYKYPEGRLTVLEAINQIITSFPQQTVQSINEIAFLQIITSRVRNTDENLISPIENTAQIIANTFTPEQIQKLLKFALTWLDSSSSNISQSGLLTLRFLQLKNLDLFIPSLREVISRIILDWNSWKVQITEQKVREKNLQQSLWANEVEVDGTVSLLPQRSEECLQIATLLSQIPIQSIEKLLEDQSTLCNLVKLTSYTAQISANIIVDLFNKLIGQLKKNIFDSGEFFKENTFKIIKSYFIQKFQLNSVIEQPQLTSTLVVNVLSTMVELKMDSNIEIFIHDIKRVIGILMAKSNMFKLAIQNLVNFFILISQKPQLLLQNFVEMIIEFYTKVQKISQLTLHMPELDELITQALKDLEKSLGSQQFVDIYSKISSTLIVQQKQRKIQHKEKAITQPDEFAKIKTKKSKNQVLKRHDKLLKLKGMAPRKIIKQ